MNNKKNITIEIFEGIRYFFEIIITIVMVIFLVYVINPNYIESFWKPIEYPSQWSKRNCDILVQTIWEYNSSEVNSVRDTLMVEFKNPKYANFIENQYSNNFSKFNFAGIEKLCDEWGEKFEHDYKRGFVFSKGPDRKHNYNDRNSIFNEDDIVMSYKGALRLVDVKLEVNPKNRDPKAFYDRLHLYFNLEVALPTSEIDLKSASATNPITTTYDTDACVFRYYDSASDNAMALKLSNLVGQPLSDLPMIKVKDIKYGNDYNELVLTFPPGYSCVNKTKKLFIVGTHYFNLVGGSKSRNKVFYEKDGTQENDGAVSAGRQLLIKAY